MKHNWVPLLSLALGPQWRSRYDSELAAIVALQLSVQPPQQQEAAAAAAAGAGRAGAAAEGQGALAPAGGAAAQQRQQQQRGQAPAAPKQPPPAAAARQQEVVVPAAQSPTSAAPLASPGFAARAYLVESVDVDGKRRRLRRKRAASPDLSGDDFQHLGQPAGGMPAPPVPSLYGGGAPARADLGGGRGEPATPVLPALHQMVERVAQLEIGGDSGGSKSKLQEQQPAQAQAQHEGRQQRQAEGERRQREPKASAATAGSVAAAGAAAAAAAAEAVPAPLERAAAAEAPGRAPGGRQERGQEGAAAGAGAGAQLLQRALLDSLGLVQDLSKRIVSDLRQVAESRGLALPKQVRRRAGSAACSSRRAAPGGSTLAAIYCARVPGRRCSALARETNKRTVKLGRLG